MLSRKLHHSSAKYELVVEVEISFNEEDSTEFGDERYASDLLEYDI